VCGQAAAACKKADEQRFAKHKRDMLKHSSSLLTMNMRNKQNKDSFWYAQGGACYITIYIYMTHVKPVSHKQADCVLAALLQIFVTEN
jgi:hypothetical protein